MKFLHFIGILFPLLGCSHALPNETDYSTHNAGRKTVASYERSVSGANVHELISGKYGQPTILLDVPLIRQNPELRYGCEVTSLAMLLQFAKIDVDKMELYRSIEKDSDPLVKAPSGDIIRWGDPARGFVGDMTGNAAGYAVFDKPMVKLVNLHLPGRAVNLTGKEFDAVLSHVSKGFPVVVWTTGDYRLPDRWESWLHGSKVISTPLDLHAVVIVGFDEHHVYINDPMSGQKQARIDKDQFIVSWRAMQSRAISYK
ncbi:C39 family peptidase [Bacillus sp. T33-2]|uniref:C39 family peptidase n=1 Tax=Bacillus sp. T33-2 TaxID=2054168 RepID=UPI000C77218A|nr:C39 family peptidase [Bacillus sp. T33-2]PLR97469.1 peptidase C39 [Bacillus sp. T33-2]